MTHRAIWVGLLAAQLGLTAPDPPNSAPPDAPQPKLIADFDPARAVPNLPGPPATLQIHDFSFSPDENWIAVAVGPPALLRVKGSRQGPAFATAPQYVLLVPLGGHADQGVRIEAAGLARFVWSPRSDTILLEGSAKSADGRPPYPGFVKLYSVGGNLLWEREGMSRQNGFDPGPAGGVYGFLDAEHLLVRRRPSRGRSAGFDSTDLQGHVVDTWNVRKDWTVTDISRERRLLLVFPSGAFKTLVADYAAKQVIRSKENPYHSINNFGDAVAGRWEYFAEGGKTVCSIGDLGGGSVTFAGAETSTLCWDVDTGKKVAEFRRFLGGIPAAVSSRGSRIVLTQTSSFPGKSSIIASYAGQRVVWDFRSNEVAAAWKLGAPQIAWLQTAAPAQNAGPVAISGTGRYAAEVAGAVLRIYQIP